MLSKNFNRVGTVGRLQGAGRSVVMRRRWFADEDGQQDKYKPTSLEDAQKIIDSLVKRVGERDATIDTLKSDMKKLGDGLKAIEAGQERQLQEQGNYKSLAEKLQADLAVLKPAAERASALENVIRQNNEAAIARIPEAKRKFIPTKYSAEDLQVWLAENAAGLMRETAPDFDAGAGTGADRPPAKLTDAERQAASLLGAKPETIEALKAQDAKK